MRVLFGVTVTYGTDIDHVIRVLNADFEQAKEEIPDIVEGPSVLGVNDLGDSGVELRIDVYKRQPCHHRAYRHKCDGHHPYTGGTVIYPEASSLLRCV